MKHVWRKASDGGRVRIKSLGLLAVMAMIVVSCGGTDQQSASGPQEGIAVHGEWTIAVYNPDGSLAARHQFANALVGEDGLFDILSGNRRVGLWEVELAGPNTSQGPCTEISPQTGTTGSCYLRSAGFLNIPSNDNMSFDLAVAAHGNPTSGFMLSGTHTATKTGQITNVSTAIWGCSTISGGSCDNFLKHNFTATSLSPISVVTDQLIRVEVVISFTSG